MSYNAIVGKIKTKNHSNADKLKLGIICGTQSIVGLNTEDDKLMILFPSNGQLSEEFAKVNDLIGYHDPETGEKKGGYFGKNRRVRAIRLRGEYSEGFVCELDLLSKVGVSQKTIKSLKEGDQFCELDKIEICRKYVTPATKNSGGKNKQKSKKKKNIRFPEHFDTKQFQYEISHIPNNSIIYITYKAHGTSGRYAFCQEEIENPWYKRLLGHPKTTFKWVYSCGSRRVDLGPKPDNSGFYGNNEFRFDFMKNVWQYMKKGEVIFGEIVGYDSNGNSIMPIIDTATLKDRKFTKQYGKYMTYKYGCPQGTHKFFVYRIAMINEDGDAKDLTWPEVKKRCELLGLEPVTDLIGPLFFDRNLSVKQLGRSVNQEGLEEIVKHNVEGPDPIDNSHIREGLCIRIEYERGIQILKHKSETFKILEEIAKDNPNYVDIEEKEDFQ